MIAFVIRFVGYCVIAMCGGFTGMYFGIEIATHGWLG